MAQEIAKHGSVNPRHKSFERGRHDTSTENSQNGDVVHPSEGHDIQISFRQNQQEMMIPPESERIREEVVKRLNLQREWQERRLVLSEKFLWVTLIGHDIAVDKIPLVSCFPSLLDSISLIFNLRSARGDQSFEDGGRGLIQNQQQRVCRLLCSHRLQRPNHPIRL